MNTTVENIGPCRIKLNLVAAAEEIDPIFKRVRAAYTQNASIPGFRKGKVPAAKINELFGKEIEARAQQDIAEFCITKASRETEHKIVGIAGIDKLKTAPGQGATLEVLADIEPTFELPEVSSWQVKKIDTTVAEDAIEKQIADVRRMASSFQAAGENDVATEDDLLSITFTSDLDAETLSDAAKIYAADKDYWVQLREDAFIPGLRDALLGKKLNESVSLTSVYPEDYRIEDLKGRTVNYQVTVTAMRKMTTADDQTILERFNLKSMDELRQRVTDQLTYARREAEERRAVADLTKAIDDSLTFDIPEGQFNDRVETILKNDETKPLEAFANDPEGLRKDSRYVKAAADATAYIRRTYALLKLAHDRKVTLTGDEMKSLFERIGHMVKMSPEKVYRRLADNGRLGEVVNEELANKVFRQLVDECAVL